MTPVDDEPYEPRTRCERAQRVASRAFWYSMGTSPENEGSCRIVIMGWGFLFVFMAFNTTQTILSTVLQHYVGSVSHVEYDLGMASLMIMYVTTCPSLYLIPAVIRNLGAVVTMMLGGLCYAVYIISLIYIWEPTVILSSAVVGFGQAAIWVSQGVILTSSSDEATRGTDAGLFWGIYSASGIAGPAFGYVVYQGIDSQGFFLFASVCTLFGVFIFRLLAKRQRLEQRGSGAGDGLEGGGGSSGVDDLLGGVGGAHGDVPSEAPLLDKSGASEAGKLAALGAKDAPPVQHSKWLRPGWTREHARDLARLVPFMFFIGSSDGFINGAFPIIFAPTAIQEGAVFLVFLGWGIMETFGALILSRFSDTLGRRTMLILAVVFYIAAMIICWFLMAVPKGDGDQDELQKFLGPVWFHVSWLAFVAGALFGLSDTLNNTQAYALIGDYFATPPLNVDAYAAFQLLQAIGMAFGFGIPLILTTEWKHRYLIFGIQGVTLLASIMGIATLPKHTTVASRSAAAASLHH